MRHEATQGRAFQAKGTASAGALRWGSGELDGQVQGIARSLLVGAERRGRGQRGMRDQISTLVPILTFQFATAT